MRSRSLLPSLIMLAAGCAADPVHVRLESKAPQYLVFRRTEAIDIDGRLSDLAWARVDATAPFAAASEGGGQADLAEARFTYDDQFLYVALRAQRSGEASVGAGGEAADQITLGIDADRNAAPSFTAAFTPAAPGAQAADCQSAFVVQDREWTAEVKIPWRAILDAPHLPPVPGDRWLVSIARREVRDGEMRLESWAPMRRSAEPGFGVLDFASRAAP